MCSPLMVMARRMEATGPGGRSVLIVACISTSCTVQVRIEGREQIRGIECVCSEHRGAAES